MDAGNMAFSLRLMTANDLAAVIAIQSEHYAGKLVEPGDIILSRLMDFPETSWVAQDAGGVCAYLAAYPTRLGHITLLGQHFDSYHQPDSLYLHDMAVARRAGGRGIGAALTRMAWEKAQNDGLQHSSLVAVPSAITYWLRSGYRTSKLSDERQISRLKAYGDQAQYMAHGFSDG